jgi:hypothetical protein
MLPICTHYLHVCTLINKIVITTKRNPIKAYIYKSPEESFETQDSKVEIQASPSCRSFQIYRNSASVTWPSSEVNVFFLICYTRYLGRAELPTVPEHLSANLSRSWLSFFKTFGFLLNYLSFKSFDHDRT